MQLVFDEEATAHKSSEIGETILVAHSLRLTDIVENMNGSNAASYKRIQCFLQQVDPRKAMWRLLQEQAEFAIGELIKIERPQTWKTANVGTIKDGKTKGYGTCVLATAC